MNGTEETMDIVRKNREKYGQEELSALMLALQAEMPGKTDAEYREAAHRVWDKISEFGVALYIP